MVSRATTHWRTLIETDATAAVFAIEKLRFETEALEKACDSGTKKGNKDKRTVASRRALAWTNRLSYNVAVELMIEHDARASMVRAKVDSELRALDSEYAARRLRSAAYAADLVDDDNESESENSSSASDAGSDRSVGDDSDASRIADACAHDSDDSEQRDARQIRADALRRDRPDLWVLQRQTKKSRFDTEHRNRSVADIHARVMAAQHEADRLAREGLAARRVDATAATYASMGTKHTFTATPTFAPVLDYDRPTMQQFQLDCERSGQPTSLDYVIHVDAKVCVLIDEQFHRKSTEIAEIGHPYRLGAWKLWPFAKFFRIIATANQWRIGNNEPVQPTHTLTTVTDQHFGQVQPSFDESMIVQLAKAYHEVSLLFPQQLAPLNTPELAVEVDAPATANISGPERALALRWAKQLSKTLLTTCRGRWQSSLAAMRYLLDQTGMNQIETPTDGPATCREWFGRLQTDLDRSVQIGRDAVKMGLGVQTRSEPSIDLTTANYSPFARAVMRVGDPYTVMRPTDP